MQLDDAYSNGAYIPGAAKFPGKWAKQAAKFRAAMPCELDVPYGDGLRNNFDLFWPKGTPRGLFVFVHGGYWVDFDKSSWSHLAAGAVENGWAVAIPSYTLCPQARIADIAVEIEAAIAAASERVAGPVHLAGHSAGGHLVARMACDDLSPKWRDRLARVVPISPVADLAPLLLTSMNANLRLDAAEVARESPVNHGKSDASVIVWVGADERPAFLDQSSWLAAHWRCDRVVAPAQHHFNVIEPLADPNSPLTKAVLS